VDELLYFDEPTRRNILEAVLAPGCRPACTQLMIQLPLTGWPRSAGARGTLLVIGSPLDPPAERELLVTLLQALPDVQVLYKPHPVYGSSGAAHVRGLNVEMVWGRDTFPAVDVVVTDWSWLGAEYEATGTPVIWHRTLALPAIVERVAALLEGRANAGGQRTEAESRASGGLRAA
jgi:hypothetical protein